jgi:hypothetical protein
MSKKYTYVDESKPFVALLALEALYERPQVPVCGVPVALELLLAHLQHARDQVNVVEATVGHMQVDVLTVRGQYRKLTLQIQRLMLGH